MWAVSMVTEVWRKERWCWNYDWQHLLITTHLSVQTWLSPRHRLGYSFTIANMSYMLDWHVFPDLVPIQPELENQTKHDSALHHRAWWCHDILNTLLQLSPTSPPIHLLGHVRVCLCMRKSVAFFWGWEVTGHVFKTAPIYIVKLNQTMQH